MSAPLQAWLARCAEDAVLLRAATGLVATVAVISEPDPPLRLALGDAPADAPCETITIAAAPETWARLLEAPVPPPGWQSFGAILRLNPAFTISGDAVVVAQALAALERMIELARPPAPPLAADPVPRDPARVTGHRARVSLPGGARWLSWLEAGDGVPLVMLHTAGADSRQYLHQLADLALMADWRMLAFDLPGHGRSGLTPGWSEGTPYTLSLADYRDCCAAFLETVAARPAVVMGCSMGAAMALVLAAERPDLVAGVIALEAPWRAPGRRSPLLSHARINPQLHNAAYVRGLLGPVSPAHHRDEACWIYSQAGYGVYAGDLGFYSDEFDGAMVAPKLARGTVPIHLLTGEYDYSASPDNTARLAEAIGHADFQIMAGLGHFPMIEHPDYFRGFLVAALSDIRRRITA